MAAKFHIRKTRGKRPWRWHFKGSNGEVVASAQSYRTERGARKGIDCIKREAPDAPVEVETSKSGS